MVRTATGTQMSPFTVRAVRLHFCISPGAGAFKGNPSFSSGAGLEHIFLQVLWLPRGDSAHPGACLSYSEGGIYCCGPYAKPLSKIRQLLPSGRQVPSLVPPEGETSLTVQAQVTTLLTGMQK